MWQDPSRSCFQNYQLRRVGPAAPMAEQRTASAIIQRYVASYNQKALYINSLLYRNRHSDGGFAQNLYCLFASVVVRYPLFPASNLATFVFTLCLTRDSAASDAPVYDLKRKKGDGLKTVAPLCPCFGFVTQAEPARSSCARSLRGMPRVVAPSRECPR